VCCIAFAGEVFKLYQNICLDGYCLLLLLLLLLPL
jgi:hypothetical protein